MHTSPIFAHHIRSWLPCIPVDNIISGRTAVTKPRRIEWKRFFFCEVGTAVWPREFYHGNLLLKQSGEVFVAIPRFLLRQKTKNTVIRFAVVWSFLWCFCQCLFLTMVTLLWFIHRDFRNIRDWPEEGPEKSEGPPRNLSPNLGRGSEGQN